MGIYSSGDYIVAGGSGYQTYPAAGAGATAYITVVNAAAAYYWGAWTEVTASTASEIAIMGVQIAVGAALNGQVEIGTGAAAAESGVGTVPFYFNASGTVLVMLPYPIIVPASTRLAARFSSSYAYTIYLQVVYVSTANLRLR